MNKFRNISILIMITMVGSLFNAIGYASGTENYKEIYLNYAKDADNNYDNELNNAISGLILTDLNRDNIPEMLAFSTSVSHFDESGNQLYALDEGYNNPAYKEYSHTLSKAFSVIDGEIVEDSPWNHEMYSEVPVMPFLPNEENHEDTEEFCTIVQSEEGKAYLAMYDLYDYGKPMFATVGYEDGRFEYLSEELDENFFDLYSYVNMPVSSVDFYDEEKKQKLTHSEAMQILLDKYQNELGSYTSVNGTTEEDKVSVWAEAEVTEAKSKNLIPEKMLDDNLTENITRAEFAAIAVQLYEQMNEEVLDFPKYIRAPITDFTGNEYYFYIMKAYFNQITAGTDSSSYEFEIAFSPDLNITREQLATMLTRVIKKCMFEDWSLSSDGEFPLDISGVGYFNDDYLISDYAYEAVYYMSKHGIIKGVDGSHFAPLDTATKEQAVLLALRIYNAIDELLAKRAGEQEKNIAVENIEISKESLTLNVGGTEMLSATVIPKNSTNQTIEWVSSNEDVVSVSALGLLKAKAIGSAAINAQVSEGNRTYIAQCLVKVVSEENTTTGTERPIIDLTTDNEDEEETTNTSSTRPVVDTTVYSEEENTTMRPERPIVDLTTDNEDEETMNTKPTRPVVDTTVDASDSETEANISQTPSRPIVDTFDESDNNISTNQRPERPVVDMSN